MEQSKPSILLVIILCQFCCTSLWFAGNAVIPDLPLGDHKIKNLIGTATSMVQFGFIIGTLVFALTMVVDRYSPSRVFFICAVLGSLTNLGLLYTDITVSLIYLIRFFTGFFLAGIYPVGMKIAADYFDKELSNNLSLLVGALVVGTSLPHLLKWNGTIFDYKTIVITISIIAALGGILLFFKVSDGPFRKSTQRIQVGAIKEIFSIKEFRHAAIGYFGHMWELYAFWTFVPVIIITYSTDHAIQFPTSLLSFSTIAIGAIGCIVAGRITKHYATKKVAYGFLASSSLCCITASVLWNFPTFIFLPILMFWGMTVIGDSALFSTLVAKHSIPEYKGTALTISTCIGFAITIVSIQLLGFLMSSTHIRYAILLLLLGPALALVNHRRALRV